MSSDGDPYDYTGGPVTECPTDGPGGPSGDGTCHNGLDAGKEVPCTAEDGSWWNSSRNQYCHKWGFSDGAAKLLGRLNPDGSRTGAFYECVYPDKTGRNVFWEDYAPPAPGFEESVRAMITLHGPTVGVGAFEYRGYEDYGLTWWIGAPMWLWLDDDPYQYGEHTVTAAIGAFATTATFTATKVEFDTGDGAAPEVCYGTGSARHFLTGDPIDRHSPTRCEHTYLVRSATGDPTSRFTVTAKVTWDVTWSTPVSRGELSFTLQSPNAPSVYIGEIKVVSVPPTPR